MTHEQLLKLVKERKAHGLKFGQGIWTADKFVESLLQCVGNDLCKRYFCAQSSIPSLLKEASNKLTFCGDDLAIEKDTMGRVKLASSTSSIKKLLGDTELPEHSMLAFAHVLTTPKEDRDGDVLETIGAEVDPKMAMLWQHVHTLLIGKMVKVVEHSAEKLRLVSVLLDVNDLTSDAAKFFEAGALRFSHGFRALEFNERNKEAAGLTGFRVKRFEIMEESAVSVPSNSDAEVELLSRGKLKSPMFISHAQAMKAMLPKVHPGVSMQFTSFDQLKSAVDTGVVKLPADSKIMVEAGAPRTDANAETEIGAAAGHDHLSHDGKAGDCGCGGKCAKCAEHKDGSKAEMPREDYSTSEEAEARATELGCTGCHQTLGAGGSVVYHPCSDPYAYSLYVPHPRAESVPAPARSAGSSVAVDSSGTKKPPMMKPENMKPEDMEDCEGKECEGKEKPPKKKPPKSVAGTQKVYIDSSSLEGSYDYRRMTLGNDVTKFLLASGIDLGRDDYAYVWSLFDGYGIICVQRSMIQSSPGEDGTRYFKADWTESDGEPKWSGNVQEVYVSSNTVIEDVSKRFDSLLKSMSIKVGRTLSKENENKLRLVLRDLAEISASDSAAISAMAERCQRIIEGVLDTAAPIVDDDPQPKQVSEREAADVILDSKNPTFLKQLRGAIETLLRVHKTTEANQKKAAEFRKLLGRK